MRGARIIAIQSRAWEARKPDGLRSNRATGSGIGPLLQRRCRRAPRRGLPPARHDDIELAHPPKRAGPGAAGARPAAGLPDARPPPRPGPPPDPADAATRRRELLAQPHPPRRPAGPRPGGPLGDPGGLDLAARRGGARRKLPDAAGPLPRSGLRPGAGDLLHLWPAGLPVRLAPGSLGAGRAQRQGRLARRLCRSLEVLDRAARPGPGAEAPPAASLRHLRQAPAADGRGRPCPAALPGLAGASRGALAGPARLLGRAEPPGGQPRRPCRQVSRRGGRALPDPRLSRFRVVEDESGFSVVEEA